MLKSLLLIICLATPLYAQSERPLDTRDDYEAMIQFNIRESAKKDRIDAANDRRAIAIQVAKLEVEIQALKDKNDRIQAELDLLQKLITGVGGGGGVVAGGWKLVSKLRGKDDTADTSSPEV